MASFRFSSWKTLKIGSWSFRTDGFIKIPIIHFSSNLFHLHSRRRDSVGFIQTHLVKNIYYSSLRFLYILVPHVVMSYLSRYVFYGNQHMLKHLNNKTRKTVTSGHQNGGLWLLLSQKFGSITLFCTFSMSVRSDVDAFFTLSHVTRGFIVIPCNRKKQKHALPNSATKKQMYQYLVLSIYLNNDSEVNYNESSADHQVLLLYLVLIQQNCQTICNSPSQTTIAHNHLIYEPNRDQPVLVQDPGKEKCACGIYTHTHTRKSLSCDL